MTQLSEMKNRKVIFATALLITSAIAFFFPHQTMARKIKLSLKTKNAAEGKKTTSRKNSSDKNSLNGMGTDSGILCRIDKDNDRSHMFYPDSILFSGYEKEVGSSRETLLVSNKTQTVLSGIEMQITYLDMSGRMLHSRKVTVKCSIPPSETRMVDFPTWDKQKTYFYYLGNEPRKVATPYKVEVEPVAYWIEADDISCMTDPAAP